VRAPPRQQQQQQQQQQQSSGGLLGASARGSGQGSTPAQQPAWLASGLDARVAPKEAGAAPSASRHGLNAVGNSALRKAWQANSAASSSGSGSSGSGAGVSVGQLLGAADGGHPLSALLPAPAPAAAAAGRATAASLEGLTAVERRQVVAREAFLKRSRGAGR
jgi:hypothetical protein